jgi:putative sigma-54 modulation protein
MNRETLPTTDAKVIIQGIHLQLTEALRQSTLEKVTRLLRHSDEIVRIRIDIEHDKTRGTAAEFVAKGRIEIRGPDLIASEQSEDAYKSVDLLVDTLDEQLRERHVRRKDLRNHPHAVELGAGLPKV